MQSLPTHHSPSFLTSRTLKWTHLIAGGSGDQKRAQMFNFYSRDSRLSSRKNPGKAWVSEVWTLPVNTIPSLCKAGTLRLHLHSGSATNLLCGCGKLTSLGL